MRSRARSRWPALLVSGCATTSGSLATHLSRDARALGQGSEGVVFVPAFSGLFAPYWRDDARGVIVGLTRFANKGHIARAALEATAYQTFDLAEAMLADTGLQQLGELRADGGMTKNELLMQFQADVLGSPGSRAVAELTATGATYASRPRDRILVGLDEGARTKITPLAAQYGLGRAGRGRCSAWGGVGRALRSADPQARRIRKLSGLSVKGRGTPARDSSVCRPAASSSSVESDPPTPIDTAGVSAASISRVCRQRRAYLR